MYSTDDSNVKSSVAGVGHNSNGSQSIEPAEANVTKTEAVHQWQADEIEALEASWLAACSPEFVAAAREVADKGVAAVTVAQLCAAILDDNTRRGDLKLLAMIARTIDPVSGIASVDRAALADDLGMQRPSLRNAFYRLRSRGAINLDGERFVAIGLGDESIQLVAAKVAPPPPTVITRDYGLVLASSPVMTPHATVITRDDALASTVITPDDASPPVMTLSGNIVPPSVITACTIEEEVKDRKKGNARRPVVENGDGTLDVHMSDGEVRHVGLDTIDHVIRAAANRHPPVSRDDAFAALKALLADIAVKPAQYRPDSRWAKSLTGGTMKLLDDYGHRQPDPPPEPRATPRRMSEAQREMAAALDPSRFAVDLDAECRWQDGRIVVSGAFQAELMSDHGIDERELRTRIDGAAQYIGPGKVGEMLRVAVRAQVARAVQEARDRDRRALEIAAANGRGRRPPPSRSSPVGGTKKTLFEMYAPILDEEREKERLAKEALDRCRRQ